uniref:Uncharacterized protein n=1 Tax=Oryza sativa subsp. japonica TaxID=39947 RepID=Q6ZGE6_ORYSJ|nr:hypothetical protein [Oryza sativa Japonica Group]
MRGRRRRLSPQRCGGGGGGGGGGGDDDERETTARYGDALGSGGEGEVERDRSGKNF